MGRKFILLISLFLLIFVSLLSSFPSVSATSVGPSNWTQGKVKYPQTATSGSSDFLGLSDTPNSYVGEGGKCVAVNGGESGLVFVACSTGGSGGNTTAEIWYVVNNGTFMSISTKTGNTTNEIWGTINNNTFMPIGTQTGNTTSQIQTAINNSGYYNISINWSNVLNPPAGIIDTDTWNTTSEIWNVVNNGTWLSATTKVGNTTAEVWGVINNGTFIPFGTKVGNTSLEMQTAINTTDYYQFKVNWSNVLNAPAFIDTATNSSYMTWIMVDNNTFIKNNSAGTWNITANKTNYWNESIGMNTTQFTFVNKVISLGESWLTNFVQAIVTAYNYATNSNVNSWIIGNRTATDNNIISNVTALDSKIIANLTVAKEYASTQINANLTVINTNIVGNGTLQRHDQDLNTTSNVKFSEVNVSILYHSLNEKNCWGNTTHKCWVWTLGNATGFYAWGGG